MKRSTAFQTAAGVLVAAAGVWIFTRQVQFGEVLQEVRRIPWWKVLVVALLNPVTLFFRSMRWQALLPEKADSGSRGLFPLVVVGFMVNNLFPMRIGEAVRAALLWKRNRYTVAESVGSILVERFLDILVFTFFLFLPILLLPQLTGIWRYGMLLAGGFFFTAICFAAYAAYPSLTRRLAISCMRPVPEKIRVKLGKVGKEVLSNFDWLFSPKRAVKVVVLSFLTLLCQVAMLQVLGIGIERIGFLSSMFGIAFAAIGAAIPLAPGYVGTLHAMMLQGMDLIGIPLEKAGAIAVLYHAIGYVTILAMGIYYFFNLKLTLKFIKEAKTGVNPSSGEARLLKPESDD